MTLQIAGAMLLTSAAYLAMFAVGELLHRRRPTPADSTRRLDHVSGGVIALALPLLFDAAWPVLTLAAAFVAFLAGTRLIGTLGSVHRVGRRSAGAFLYPVAVAATFVLAADRYAAYATAILVLALADPAAAVVGRRFGAHAYAPFGQRKTWEGSLATLLVTSAITGTVLLAGGATIAETLATSAFTGVVVALVEGAIPWGLDNVAIPLATLAALAAAASIMWVVLALLGAGALFVAAIHLVGPGKSATRASVTSSPVRPDAG